MFKNHALAALIDTLDRMGTLALGIDIARGLAYGIVQRETPGRWEASECVVWNFSYHPGDEDGDVIHLSNVFRTPSVFDARQEYDKRVNRSGPPTA